MRITCVIILLDILTTVEGWSCDSSIRNIYSRVDTNAVLQFTADLSGIQVHRQFDVFFYDNSHKARVRFNSDGSFTTGSADGVSITGDTSGNVDVTLASVQQSSAGIYYMTSTGIATRCSCLYILGIPTKPVITINRVPSVGESTTLICSSISTTTPSNHSLSLTYNWRVDNVDNPDGSKYSYSKNRNILTLSNIVKDDAYKQFTCTATEDVSDGYTSSSSNYFSMNVYYGPDNLGFSPSDTRYERTENSNFDPVTCTASCYPNCTFMWTKIGQGADVTSTAVLSLGTLTSSKAGVYRCTATRSGSITKTKDLTINVIYGPESMSFTPETTSYRHEENFDLPPVTCSAECWGCIYSWTGPHSYSSSGQILDLNNLSRSMAGSYSCTARNTKLSPQTQRSKSLQIEVRYGPESITFSPGNINYIVDEGSTLSNIKCEADCFPACKYEWTKEGQSAAVSNTDTLPLGQIDKSDAGKYTCRATNGDTPSRWFEKNVIINVRYGPYQSSTILSPSAQEYTKNEGGTLQNISCSADCYPDCTYTWTKTRQGKRTIVSTTGVLSLGSLHLGDAAVYICTANNPGKSVSSETTKQVIINVRYGPDTAGVNVQSPYYTTEGDRNINVECSSDCYPGCSYVWTNQSDSSRISSSGVLSFQLVNRYMAGDYKCTSSNTATEYTKSSEKTVSVVVQYAPDVTVRHSSTSTTEGESLTLYCDGSGVPSTYSYVILKQTWRNTEIPNNNQAQTGTEQYSSITFSPLKLEDTGTYTCILNNGVKDTAEVLDQSGSTQLLVKVRPKVLTDELRFTGSIGGTAQIQIYLYSYPTLESITVKRYDGEVISTDRYNITSEEVKTVFYGKLVTLNGSIIELKISNLKETDFGKYTFELENTVGIENVYVFVKAESRPLPPKVFQILPDLNNPTFLWQKDSNGGLEQSFIIQTMLAGSQQWRSKIHVNERDKSYQINSTFYKANIDGLQPGIYIARIFSRNRKGDSEYVYLGTTFDVGEQVSSEGGKSSSSAPIAAGVSSAVVGVVVVIGITAFLIWKKSTNKGQTDKGTYKNNQSGPSSQVQYEDLQGEREKDQAQTYESLDETCNETSAYASLTDKTDRPATTIVNSGNDATGSDAVYENLKLKGMTAAYIKSKN